MEMRETDVGKENYCLVNRCVTVLCTCTLLLLWTPRVTCFQIPISHHGGAVAMCPRAADNKFNYGIDKATLSTLA